jgi:CBS domain-containing protein
LETVFKDRGLALSIGIKAKPICHKRMNIRDARLEEAHTLPSDTPLVDAAKLLRDKKLRHVYILDEKEFPIGIVSITDISGKVVAEGKSPEGMVARDIMTTPLHMMDADNELSKAYMEMVNHATITLPIVDNGLLIGVLSMGEALKALAGVKRA